MDIARATAFVQDHHRAVLVTRRADGGLQSAPILAGVDGEGRAIISTTEPSAKVRNLRRDPRATLCVMTDRFFGDWVRTMRQTPRFWGDPFSAGAFSFFSTFFRPFRTN